MEHRITIEVSKGMVQSVYTTITNMGIEVDVLDFDCLESESEREDKKNYLRAVESEHCRIY